MSAAVLVSDFDLSFRLFLTLCVDEVSLISDRSCDELRTDPLGALKRDTDRTEHGWTTEDVSATVCAASELVYNVTGQVTSDDGCQTGSIPESEKVCAMNGARLCTANELFKVARGTGMQLVLLFS